MYAHPAQARANHHAKTNRDEIRKSMGDCQRIAVGTAVAGGPPHRSQRAGLPHWAPALGSGVEPRVREQVLQAAGPGRAGQRGHVGRPVVRAEAVVETTVQQNVETVLVAGQAGRVDHREVDLDTRGRGTFGACRIADGACPTP